MRNYDIIKEIWKLTQKPYENESWRRQRECEVRMREIEGVIAEQRPQISGPILKEEK